MGKKIYKRTTLETLLGQIWNTRITNDMGRSSRQPLVFTVRSAT